MHCGASMSWPLPNFTVLSPSPSFPEVHASATPASSLFPGHALTHLTPYFCPHCSLHLRCSSPLCSSLKSHALSGRCSNATSFRKHSLIPPLRMTALWYFPSSSLVLSFPSSVLAIYIFLSFSKAFKFFEDRNSVSFVTLSSTLPRTVLAYNKTSVTTE